MEPAARMAARCDEFFALVLPFSLMFVAAATPAVAAGCSFELQGEGRVAEVLDARSFRLQDGREVRLAGIEPVVAEKANRTSALSAIIAGRDVTLRGEDDTPDRYGRQPAFVFLASSETLVQSLLLAQGDALVSATVTNKDCALILTAEGAFDIWAGIGCLTLVEGKVLSVRQAGPTTYLNFGRNWTRDFAVTISRRTIPAVEAAGIVLKSLENRRIRVRGWVEARGGPRIEVLRVGQIELLGGN